MSDYTDLYALIAATYHGAPPAYIAGMLAELRAASRAAERIEAKIREMIEQDRERNDTQQP